MTVKSYRAQQILLLKDTKKDLDALIDNFITYISGLLVRYTNKNGEIPVTATHAIKQQIRREFTKIMLGTQTNDGHLTPFIVHDNKVTPHSAYASLLWSYITKATELGVLNQSSMLRKLIAKDDVDSIKNSIPPLNKLRSLITNHISPLSWIDPQGRKLSDRIWNISGDISRKLDRFLEAQLLHRNISTATDEEDNTTITTQGNSISDISKSLIISGIFFGIQQLALNEVYRALIYADYTAATINPLIDKYHPHVSSSHKIEDTCDLEESNGPYLITDKSHLPPFHVNCLCDCDWITLKYTIDISQYKDNIWILLFGSRYLINLLLNS